LTLSAWIFRRSAISDFEGPEAVSSPTARAARATLLIKVSSEAGSRTVRLCVSSARAMDCLIHHIA
jgi:hypothetical protein